MPDTCILCEYHVWSDSKKHHVCLNEGGGAECRVDRKPCEKYRISRRGQYNLTYKSAVIDMNALEGNVRDDKYTRRKK